MRRLQAGANAVASAMATAWFGARGRPLGFRRVYPGIRSGQRLAFGLYVDSVPICPHAGDAKDGNQQ